MQPCEEKAACQGQALIVWSTRLVLSKRASSSSFSLLTAAEESCEVWSNGDATALS